MISHFGSNTLDPKHIFVIEVSNTSELIKINSTLSIYLSCLYMLFSPVNNYILSINFRMKIFYFLPSSYRKIHKIISVGSNFF